MKGKSTDARATSFKHAPPCGPTTISIRRRYEGRGSPAPPEARGHARALQARQAPLRRQIREPSQVRHMRVDGLDDATLLLLPKTYLSSIINIQNIHPLQIYKIPTLLPTTYHLLSTACYLMPTIYAYFLLPSYCLLPTTITYYYLLRATCYVLPQSYDYNRLEGATQGGDG